MADYITDPELLKLLGTPSPAPAQPEYVTDPQVLKQLTGPGGLAVNNMGVSQAQREAFARAMTAADAENEVQKIRRGRGIPEAAAHAASVTGRNATQGAVGGTYGVAGAMSDIGRNVVYGAKKALASTGVVDQPDPKNYGYREDDEGISSYFPGVRRAAETGAALADKAGFDQPETRFERIISAVQEGAVSAGTTAGVAGAVGVLPGVAGRVGRVMAARPGMQVASGAAAGAGGQGAQEAGANGYGVTAASLLASVLPSVAARTGRVTVFTPEGQRAAAGEALRERVSGSLPSILHNLDTVGERTRTPGFRHLGTDAAQDLGLAAVAPKLRNWGNEEAGGAVARVKQGNDEVLSTWLDRLGAERNTAQTTRAVQAATDSHAIDNMVLPLTIPSDVTPLMDQLERGTNIRRTGARSDVGKAHREMLERLTEGAHPRIDAKGNLIGYDMPGPNLLSARQDFSQARQPGSLTNPNPSSLKNARRETRPHLDRIDEMLDEASDGQYMPYLRQSRAGRTAADNQEFMEDFANSVNPQGAIDPVTGARVINPGAWTARVNNKADMPLPSGKKSMSIEKLDPMRRSFLEGASADLNDAQFANRIPSYGPNTASKLAFEQRTKDIVEQRRSPYARTADTVLSLVGLGSNSAARLVHPLAGTAGRVAERMGGGRVARRTAEAELGVQRVLGMAEADPAEMARLLRTPKAYNPGYGGTLAVKGRNVAQTLGQSFLAGERTKRYR